ncbi:hypothetical protein [Streptomyces sp. NPDC088258]|uniref:hypothetical protein n=1 Tax=Streptomyces sp. NPDC088258 TaxID=3365849 RepID=UPI003806E5E2
MDAIQQYMLDSYRASLRGEIAPPPPGRYDRETLRTIREYQRVRRVAGPPEGTAPDPVTGPAAAQRAPLARLARLLRRPRRRPRAAGAR